MGVSTSEKRVVKLVHPGRHVETHTQPITAAEVMSRNPRHCIARPDVFQFPWIVVRPESVLVPGEVFYIVPYRTISDLLKAKKQRDQSSTQQNNSQKIYHDGHGRSTPKYQHHDRCLVNPFKTAQVNSWPKVIDKKRCIQQEPEKKYRVHASINARDGRFTETITGLESGKTRNGDNHMSYETVVELKSCLRKQASCRKTRNLKKVSTNEVWPMFHHNLPQEEKTKSK
ncbi:hypothetical protein LguiA_011715 [Lonicera macranthoides]